MSPGVAYTRAKYLRVWVLTVTIEVDSTGKEPLSYYNCTGMVHVHYY